ncbi:MAG: desulfoferrodoxin family protein [Methanomicrobiaceae archaeon]|nr:desulfoferrodoxin family protein [Methanomicrobiaceae archaeon]
MLEILKCNQCGKLVMVVRNGTQGLTCCDQDMERLVEKSDNVHVPQIEGKNQITVSIPGVASPMGRDHYIEWIEVFDGPYLHVKGLNPDDAPEAEFTVTSPRVKVRTYCEAHGLCSSRPSKR